MKEVARDPSVNAKSRAEAPLSGEGASESRGNRFFDLVAQETVPVRPAIHAVQGFGSLLPQFCFNRLRTNLWRAAKVRIGERSLLMGDVILSGEGDWPSLFSVGYDTFITGPLRINLGGSVHIGNNVNIGHDCLFLTVDHEIGPPWRRAGWSTNRAIVVEDGAWIASRVTILPGVTVGQGAVVAAGAVVASHVAPHTMVGGVPAKVLRKLSSSPEP
jgi:serine acetyltransferase